MVAEVRLYVEGGGEGKNSKGQMRQGFSKFLSELCDKARENRIRWNIIACGSRNSAFDDFNRACRTHAEAFNVLLVDSEGPVSKTPRQHLREKDKWDTNGREEQYQLMAQTMEAWIIADTESLQNFYGQAIRQSAIPNQQDVEQIDKEDILRNLNQATRNTQKGTYHKIRHGAELLSRINPQKVCKRAQHCKRLFETLGNIILE